MARLKVNPTRMELRRLKDRLKTAQRGHKLLKDKSDEMIRQFMLLINENKKLRKEVEGGLSVALEGFAYAKAISNEYELQEALQMPTKTTEISVSTNNVMSVLVPIYTMEESKEGDLFPYSFSSITQELDSAILTISNLSEKMVKLAEVEKTCNMLALEIEKNKRRVNALEYFMIPQIEETIKFIEMKLEENERGNIVRLMKVKDIIKE